MKNLPSFWVSAKNRLAVMNNCQATRVEVGICSLFCGLLGILGTLWGFCTSDKCFGCVDCME